MGEGYLGGARGIWPAPPPRPAPQSLRPPSSTTSSPASSTLPSTSVVVPLALSPPTSLCLSFLLCSSGSFSFCYPAAGQSSLCLTPLPFESAAGGILRLLPLLVQQPLLVLQLQLVLLLLLLPDVLPDAPSIRKKEERNLIFDTQH